MLKIEVEREDDGRRIAEAPALQGELAYGNAEAQARTHAVSLAPRVIADRSDNDEPLPKGSAQSVRRMSLDGDKGGPRLAGAPPIRLDPSARKRR